jgi:multidrug resistance efflux pump
MLMYLRHRRILWGVLALVGAVGVGTAVLSGKPFGRGDKPLGKPVADDGAVPAKVIRPKRDSQFGIAVQQLATVEPYFQANLRARASGVVKYVQKDIGDRVRQGELLVEVDVPELVQEVAQKAAVIAQRQHEVDMARSAVRTAEAQLDVGRATVDQRRAELEKEKTTRDTRQKRLARFRNVRSRDVVDAGVIDEEEGQYLAAVAAVSGAEMAIKRAEADLREKQASLEGARAEVSLKEALVEVARRDRDRAQAMLDYARVTAPFDGIITARNVDPGAFVQNATTSNTEALVSVARTDIVTVVFNLPDYAAAYVSRGTVVDVQLDELPGVTIHGRVTRFTPAIRGGDRTVRVEVDLFNGTEAQYRAFLAIAVACGLAPLGGAGLTAVAPSAAADLEWAPNHKGAADALPVRPENAAGGAHRALVAGMGGVARVQLQEFDDVFLLPTSAIFSVGGKTYLLELYDGKTRLLPVRVQVNDGRLAKVVVVAQPTGARANTREVVRELTGDEQIIASRQLEIGEGQAVRATAEDW